MRVIELRQICQKGSAEPYWISRYFVRPISIYFTKLFIKLNISPNTVTFASSILALSGSFILIKATLYSYILSAILVFSFFFLDHVDGELARYYSAIQGSKKESYIDISGKFFDRIIHYFQGASFYVCLGMGLTMQDGNIIWFFAGLIGGLGSSGFPRFVACFDMLNIVEKNRSSNFFNYIEKNSKFNVVHFSEERVVYQQFKFPNKISDVVLIARQIIGFPGNLVLYFIVVIVNSTLFQNSYLSYQIYLSLFAVVLFGNSIYSLRKYLKTLSKIPY